MTGIGVLLRPSIPAVRFSPAFSLIPLSVSGVPPCPFRFLPLGFLLSSAHTDILIELLWDPEILSAAMKPLGPKAFLGMPVSILPSFSGHSAVSGWAFLRIREGILPKVDVLPNLRKPLSRVRRGACLRQPLRRRTCGFAFGLLMSFWRPCSVANEALPGPIRRCREPFSSPARKETPFREFHPPRQVDNLLPV